MENEETQQPTPPNPTPQGPPTPTATFTQADVDRFVQERLARERQKRDRELADLGVQSFDEVKTLIEQQRKAEETKLAEQGHYKQLFEKTKAESEAAIQAERQRVAALEQQNRQANLKTTLLGELSAKGCVSPQEAATLISASVRYDDEGNAYPVDATGAPLTNGEGGQLTVTEFASRWLEERPHYQRAASSAGAGSNGNDGPPPAAFKLDPSRINDPDYMLANRDKVRVMLEKG